MGKDSKLKVDGLWIVAVFVIILLFFFYNEAKSDEVFVEAGSTVLSGETSKGGALILGQRFGQWEVAGGVLSPQECRCNWPEDIGTNIFVQGQRIVSYKSANMGIGMAYWQNTNRALGKNFTWSLLVGWQVNERLSLQIRHWSNAGSGKPNLGQDLLSATLRFK